MCLRVYHKHGGMISFTQNITQSNMINTVQIYHLPSMIKLTESLLNIVNSP